MLGFTIAWFAFTPGSDYYSQCLFHVFNFCSFSLSSCLSVATVTKHL